MKFADTSAFRWTKSPYTVPPAFLGYDEHTKMSDAFLDGIVMSDESRKKIDAMRALKSADCTDKLIHIDEDPN